MTDERLARRAAEGDRRAFEQIYRRYQQDLYRFCLATTRNPQDAQDALQNTMVKAMRALPGEERQIKLKPWLYRIARNEAIETVRRRRQSAELEPEDVDSGMEIAETAEARDRLRNLFADLEQLPERQRAALVMRELAGLGFEQIGEAFGSSAAVARQTLYEARLSLRQMEAGREMDCDEVMRALSDADGRKTRRRDIRAHLRGCADCRAFGESIAERRADLAAITALPLAASAALLQGAFGAGASTGGVAGTLGAGAGKVVAMSALVKSAATVAVVAVGVTAADRGGVIDVPLPRGGTESATDAFAPATSPPAGPASPTQPAAASPQSAEATRKRKGGSANRPAAESVAHGGGGANSRPPGPASRPAGPRPDNPGKGSSQGASAGKPAGLPLAANRGQETAAARKPPQANPAPGGGGSGGAGKPPPEPAQGPATPKGSVPPVPSPVPAQEPPAGAKAKGTGIEAEAPAP